MQICCSVLLFPLLLSAEHRPALWHRAEKHPGTFDFHSRWNVTLWFPVLTFKRREARKRGVLIRAAKWRSASEGGRQGGMKEDSGWDGGEGRWKEEEDGKRGWVSIRATGLWVSGVDVCVCIPQISRWLSLCFSVFNIQLSGWWLNWYFLPCCVSRVCVF